MGQYDKEVLDDIECYKAILDGRLKRFPTGMWEKPWSYESAKRITKYALDKYYKNDIDKLKRDITTQTFTDLKLYGMLVIVYEGSAWKALNSAYNKEDKVIINPWELKYTPKGFWDDKENIKNAIRWAVEDVAPKGFNIKTDFNVDYLKSVGLNILRNKYSLFTLIDIAYPNKYFPWEMTRLSDGYWDDIKNVKECLYQFRKKELDISCNNLNDSGFGRLYHNYSVDFLKELKLDLDNLEDSLDFLNIMLESNNIILNIKLGDIIELSSSNNKLLENILQEVRDIYNLYSDFIQRESNGLIRDLVNEHNYSNIRIVEGK